MPAILQEAFSVHNFPATVFLGIILGYWVLAIIGMVDLEVGADVGGDGHGLAEAAEAGFWARCGRFLHLGQVPLIVGLSFLALFLWPLSILGNYYLNGTPGDRSAGFALALLVPNVFVSLLLTRVAITPLKRLFAVLHGTKTEAETVVGRAGKVVSAEVDERYGQLEIATSGAPLLVNVRTATGDAPLPRGASAVVFAAAPDHSHYLVKLLDSPDSKPTL